MGTTWIGCASDNFRKDRPIGMKPEILVLHTCDGSLADAAARCNRPGTNLSAHYAVGLNGEIQQYVVETDTAFHAGFVVNPTARLVRDRQKINPNFYTIGIEFEGKRDDPWTAAQSVAAADLLHDISARWGIPLDREHVIAHQEIRASVNCPGSGADINALLNIPALAEESAASNIMSITLVSNVNLRSRASVTAPIVRVATAGSTILASGVVVGDAVNGNALWYQDKEGNFFWAGATDRPSPQMEEQPADNDATTDTMNRHDPDINRTSLSLPAGQFYQERHDKDLIILHFTAGTDARSAFDYWAATPDHIATAYIVDIDGVIYEVFDPAKWAFHMGIKGSNGRHDKRSIGIEIANVGPLRPSVHDPSRLNWWPPNNKFEKKFCTIGETGKYVKIDYRNEKYFASFPMVQVEAVRDLVSHLCERFSIAKVLPPESKQFVCDLEYFNDFCGVATHANFRKDKWDIGPGFDWEILEIERSPS